MLVVCSRHSTYQLPITNYQLPITNYQLPITNYQYFGYAVPQSFGFAQGNRMRTAVKVTNYQLPITTTQKNDRK
ncbi:hypothetical protein QUB08_10945 [Microcoleus sp. BR0-C5]|uniref:hypothetical protein n=1 Tax=Microcoleus sp. BR0-C5 TaxID=2818713 RepID=UPI002FD4E704